MSREKIQIAPGRFSLACVLWLFLVLSLPVQAHRSYESHLFLDLAAEPTLRWEIETRNFETLFALDDNGNDIVSWSELSAHEEELLAYAGSAIAVRANGTESALTLAHPELKRVDDETYLVVQVQGLPAERIEQFALDYDLFFDIDPQQRLLLKVHTVQGDALYTMGPERRRLVIAPGYGSMLERFADFVLLGGEHIVSGYDHLVFLLMLVVAVLLSQNSAPGRPVVRLLKLVTAFSVAHSLTLMLTASGVIFLPPAGVELGIALTVLWAAMGNVLGRPHALSWPLVFLFGLIHGFGFANALREMELTAGDFITMMLGFNLGVEIGQVLMVVAVLPVLVLLRQCGAIYRFILRGISAFSVVAAVLWVVERV